MYFSHQFPRPLGPNSKPPSTIPGWCPEDKWLIWRGRGQNWLHWEKPPLVGHRFRCCQWIKTQKAGKYRNGIPVFHFWLPWGSLFLSTFFPLSIDLISKYWENNSHSQWCPPFSCKPAVHRSFPPCCSPSPFTPPELILELSIHRITWLQT